MDSHSSEEPPATENWNGFDEANPESPRWSSLSVAWIAMLAAILWIIVPNFLDGKHEKGEASIVGQEIYAKYLIGLSNLPFAPKDDFRDMIASLFEQGPLRQRLMGTVLVGEFDGPEAARKSLQRLEKSVESKSISTTQDDEDTLHLLLKVQQSRIDHDDIESQFENDERRRNENLLTERLGWVGKLALLPRDTAKQIDRSNLLQQARRTLFVVLGVAAFAGMAILCGVVIQLMFWICAASGQLQTGIGPIRGDYVVYAETFAVWMILYVALSRLISLPFISKWGMITILIPQIVGLSALAWPVIRGVGWRDVCQDVGLTWGRQSWTNPFVGIATYLSAFPVLVAGAVIALGMMAIARRLGLASEEGSTPIHPVVEPILRGNWPARLRVLLVVVFAAVPEEIMFRGVFYRHLRELGARFRYIGSVLFATFFSSFVFAAIHPQGLVGIPLLMGLAMVFAMAREWRGTLIPSMIAHACVNAGTSCILFLLGD